MKTTKFTGHVVGHGEQILRVLAKEGLHVADEFLGLTLSDHLEELDGRQASATQQRDQMH